MYEKWYYISDGFRLYKNQNDLRITHPVSFLLETVGKYGGGGGGLNMPIYLTKI